MPPPTIYRDFEYIEGPIKELPAVLKQQIISHDGEDFARSNWKPEDAKPRCLDQYRDGCPTEFVCRDDQAMPKLSAGRFRWRRTKHIVVIGLPDTRDENGLRYVIAALPEKSWDLFSIMTSRPGNWKGSIWNIWKPEGVDGQYYEGVPDTVLRVKTKGPGVDRYNTDMSVPARTAVPMLNPRPENASPQDRSLLKRQPALPIINSTTTKRKLSFGTSSKQSPRPKKPYEENKRHERPAPTTSMSGTCAASSDLNEMQESLSVSNDLPLPDRVKARKRESPYHPASKVCQASENASAQAKPSAQSSTSGDAEHTSPLPPHENSVRGFDTVASVKQEIVDTDSPKSSQATPFSGDSSSTAARSVSQGGKIKLVLTSSKILRAKTPPPARSPFTSDESYQTPLEGLQRSMHISVQMSEETHESTSRGPEHTLALPPQKQPLHDNDGVNTALVPVKQEVVDTDTAASFQALDSKREIRSTTVRSRTKGANCRSLSGSTQSSAPKGLSTHKPALASNSSRQTGAIDMIDLTDDDDDAHGYDKFQQISDQQINVSFIDEHGREQHTIPFGKYNTAEGLFEEACVWDIADKETKMLEIKIPGRKPARVRKNNEENFTQKVIRPLQEISSSAGADQPVTLTVQKYM